MSLKTLAAAAALATGMLGLEGKASAQYYYEYPGVVTTSYYSPALEYSYYTPYASGYYSSGYYPYYGRPYYYGSFYPYYGSPYIVGYGPGWRRVGRWW